MSSNEPVKNGCEVIYEMLNCDEVLTFSGFYMQLLKLHSLLRSSQPYLTGIVIGGESSKLWNSLLTHLF